MARLQTKILLVLSLTGLATTIGFGAFLINSKTIEASYGVNENLKPVAYIEGSNVQYSSIEKALEVANDLARSGTIQNVYVIPGTNPTISRQCIVGSNVNLILPYEGTTYYNEETGKESEYNGSNFADNNPDTFRKNSVKVSHLTNENGSTIPTIIVNSGGTISIGGYRGYNIQGGTSGRYCELVLDDNALIQCDGKIDCRGYIKETRDNNGSMIEVSNTGTISQPVIVYDWGSSKYANANIEKNVFPFNLFDLIQVNPIIRLYSGSRLEGLFWIYGTTVKDNPIQAYVIGGEDDTALIKSKNSDGTYYIDWKSYDSNSGTSSTKTYTNHHININVYGDWSFESLEISIKSMVTINSADYEMPLSGPFNITLKQFSTFDINNKIKFLPGSKVTIERGATANVNANVSIYASNTDKYGNKIINYPTNTPSEFINNGILNINSGFGGNIVAGTEGDTSSVINTSPNLIGTNTKDTIARLTGDNLAPSNSIVSVFSYNPTSNILVNQDDLDYVENAELEPSKTYSYTKDNNEAYWSIDGYLINFIKEDSDLSKIDSNPTYNIEVTRSDRTIETFSNPTSIRMYDGDTFKFTDSSTSIDKIIIEDQEITDFLDQEYLIDHSFDVTIFPTQIESSKIQSMYIEYSTDNGETWSNADTLDSNGDILIFRAVITTVDGNTSFSPLTTYQWESDNVVVGNDKEYAGTFKSEKSTTIKLTLVDGLDSNNIFEDSFTIKVTKPTCILFDTMITMGDGSTKPVQDIKLHENIIAYDFVSGTYIPREVVYFKEVECENAYIITIYFDDGTKLETSGGQGFFDVDKLEYFVIEKYDESFLSRKVLGFNNNDKSIKTIVNIETECRRAKVYEIVTAYNYNFVANNILTVEPLIGKTNIFKINENLMYDQQEMMKDIMKYGLYGLDDVKDFCSKQQFVMYNVAYLKVAVGKSLLTLDDIRNIVNTYRQYSID